MNKPRRWDHAVRWEGMKIAASYMAIRDEGKYVLTADYDALSAEVERLRAALSDAAQSLETIDKLAGRDEYMQGMVETRSYARNRAGVARASLAGKEGE